MGQRLVGEGDAISDRSLPAMLLTLASADLLAHRSSGHVIVAPPTTLPTHPEIWVDQGISCASLDSVTRGRLSQHSSCTSRSACPHRSRSHRRRLCNSFRQVRGRLQVCPVRKFITITMTINTSLWQGSLRFSLREDAQRRGLMKLEEVTPTNVPFLRKSRPLTGWMLGWTETSTKRPTPTSP